MQLFCFASRSLRNIVLGVQHRLWAVATLTNAQSMAARVTKADRNLFVGAVGLLYCNPTHSFTVPFLVKSRADLRAVVTDVWPEPWRLPFAIEPLGDPTVQLPAREATERWPFLAGRMGPKGGVSAAMNITGTTVFVPVPISGEDWKLVCDDLGARTS